MAEQVRTRHYTSKSIDEHVGYIAGQLERSLKDGETRKLAGQIVSGTYDYARDPRSGKSVPVISAWGHNFRAPPDDACKARDEECEIGRIWDFMVLNVRYTEDPVDADTFATLKETLLMGAGDCFAAGTLVLRDDYEVIPIEYVQPGMKIWGKDRWSKVEAHVYKGILPISLIHLNNGSVLRLTEDHDVEILHCPRHVDRPKAPPCSCPPEERELVKMHVSELQPGMVLPQPDTIPFGTGQEDPDMSWIKGLYIADGWSGHPGTVEISGQDDQPKAANKARVQEICERLGIPTRMHRKYISIKDKQLTQELRRCGKTAPEKHVLTIDLDRENIYALLEGIMADSGANTNGQGRTFTTTSYKLMLQTRLLHRMLGVACGYTYITNHGRLGTNPIHRLYVHSAGDKQQKLLRVKSIDREILYSPAYDITTDDHYVYLAAHDVTVMQCDDSVIGLGALLKSVGYNIGARVISTKDAPDEWVHIYPLAGTPKERPSKWIPLDTTVDGAYPGWQYGRIAKARDYRM